MTVTHALQSAGLAAGWRPVSVWIRIPTWITGGFEVREVRWAP